MILNLKNSIGLLCLAALIFSSCSRGGGRNESGELLGVTSRPDFKTNISPHGMEYIRGGNLHIGNSGQDIFSGATQRNKTVSIPGFFMDDSEITNNEYREFVYHVRDSVAHSLLDHYMSDEDGNEKIDWEYEIDWADEGLEDLFVDGDNTLSGQRLMDNDQLNFEYRWKDWQAAAHSRDRPGKDFIFKEKVNIYPDTMVWIRDFGYAMNEPMTRNYFWHPAFDDYPVVGVTWKQANAFCYWRTQLWNVYKPDEPNSEHFRLPTEFEWEYAARGGLADAPFPWGAYYLRNAKGCLRANFKPGRGNYSEDGGIYTVDVYKYFPNKYGLYQMAGNVAEWTSSSYEESSYSFIHDLSPDMQYNAKDDDPIAYKRKVIRGGSWKDVGYYLQTGTRHWEYQDTAKSYIGFRCALSYLGRSINDR